MPTATNPYTARTFTFVPGSQVRSADMNAIQDGIIAVGEEMEDRCNERMEARTATTNQADSPAPDIYGGGRIWLERSTNGLNVVTLDTSIDWRDRFIEIAGLWTNDSTMVPGGANEDTMDRVLTNGTDNPPAEALHLFGYTAEGSDGSADPRVMWIPDDGGSGYTENIAVYANAATGHLCMKKTVHTADPDWILLVRIDYSPAQNHH